MSDAVVRLRWPAEPVELWSIEDSGMCRFPSPLPGRPILYPVMSEDYAPRIVRKWNMPANGAGFVTRFDVRKTFLDAYQIEEAGGRMHREYGIPAADLDAFNAAIVGPIAVAGAFPE